MKRYRELGDVGAVGIELVVSIALCYWAGHWADARWFGGRGWMTLAGFILGVVVGFKAIFDASRRATRRMAMNDREEREARERAMLERQLKERHERERERGERNGSA